MRTNDSFNFFTSEKDVAFIVDMIADPIFVKDLKHRWIFANQAFANLLGKNKEDFIGKSDHDFFPKEMADHFWRMDDEVFQSKQTSLVDEKVLNPQGETIYISTKKLAVNLSNGELILIGIIRDITDRKKLEAQLVQSSKLASLGQMAAGIAHEINNPLAIISASLLSMQKKLVKDGKELLEGFEKFFDLQFKNIDRISKIVLGLKTFARDTQNDPFLKTSLKQVIQDTLALCSERARIKGIELIYDQGFTDILIYAQPIQLSQVLVNLINNAVDAIDESTQTKKWIEIKIDKTKTDKICIHTTNNGPIIPKEIRNHLWDPFFTTKDVGKGTGLGLSISHSIIEAHKGRIFLNEDRPHTCFTIELPECH